MEFRRDFRKILEVNTNIIISKRDKLWYKFINGQYGDNEGNAAAIQDGMDDYKKGNN